MAEDKEILDCQRAQTDAAAPESMTSPPSSSSRMAPISWLAATSFGSWVESLGR
jgi:hypothetical protein